MSAMIRGHMKFLQLLQKAVFAGNITAIVPEDLEIVAHSLLWSDTDDTELMLMKYLPHVMASSVKHEFTNMTSYGIRKGSGFFGERSLPSESAFESQRFIRNIRLMGEISPTFILAAMEQTQQAFGVTGAEQIAEVAVRLNVLQKMNRNLYFSDTTKTRLGAASLRYPGILQQIREGTDGTVLSSPLGASHIIDMKGAPLTLDTVRNRIAQGIQVFGRIRQLFMDPLTRNDFETSMDGAARLAYGAPEKPFYLGQNLAGIQTQGGKTRFITDNTLSAIYSREQYTVELEEGAPTTVPLVSASAGSPGGGRVSSWDVASAGNIFYVVTETFEEKEGLGTRFPTTPSTYLAVAAGQEVTLTLTPGNALADSFRVYREVDTNDTGLTSAWFIFEVANTGAGAAVTAFDNNDDRPNHGYAFGLRVHGTAADAMLAETTSAYTDARARSAEFLADSDQPNRNTVAVACLGPRMGIMALAAVMAQTKRPLIYSAHVPEVRNPFQNLVFKNIGRL